MKASLSPEKIIANKNKEAMLVGFFSISHTHTHTHTHTYSNKKTKNKCWELYYPSWSSKRKMRAALKLHFLRISLTTFSWFE